MLRGIPITHGTQLPSPADSTRTEPDGRYVYGRAILSLTDQLRSSSSYEDAAALTDQILDPIDGLLERLQEFFDAAGNKAKEAGTEDGLDLHDDLAHAAHQLRRIGEDLHVATDVMRVLVPAQPAALPVRADGLPPMPSPSVSATGRTR